MLQGQLYVDKVEAPHRPIIAAAQANTSIPGGTSGLISQWRMTSGQCRMSGQRTTCMHVCAVCCPKHAGPRRGLTKCGRKSIQRTLTKQPCRQRTNIYVKITSSRQACQQRTQSAAVVGFSVSRAPHTARLITQVLSTLAANELDIAR